MTITVKMKSLVKKLIAPVVLATALLFSPVKANAQTFTINPFSQPNDTTLAYYGSGDVDLNNVRDWNDHNLISQGAQNDQADIDGDGILGTAQDAELFAKYLNGDTLLPQINWAWPNMTREQRQEWFLKEGIIDSTRFYHSDWFCGPLATNVAVAFHGFPELNNPEIAQHFSKYDLQNNGRFNLPVYYVTIAKTDGSGWAHAINACLIGEDPLNFDDWCFFEPRFANKINIGDWDMPENSKVKINSSFFSENGGISTYAFAKFILNNGVPSLDGDPSQYLILQRPYVNSIKPNNKSLLEKFVLAQNYPNPFNSQTEIKYSIPKAGTVLLNVYNLEGKLIRTLINNHQQAGDYRVTFNAKDLPSGQYFYRLRTEDAVETKKMMLVK